MVLAAVERNELIHDAALHADEIAFGLLTDARELDAADGVAGNGGKRERSTDFNGGGRAEACAHRDFAVNDEIRARESEAGLFELQGDADRIVAPSAGRYAGRGVGIEIKRNLVAELFGINDEFAIVPRRDGHPTIESNGGGHDEPVVVIGVFADQID